MEATSSAWITASGRTLQNSAILLRSDSGTGRSQRQSRMSGWMPIERSSFTECCVGLVLSSPALGMNGSRVRWMNTQSPRGSSLPSWRMASKNGRPSMSPTVPPISTSTKSMPSLPDSTNCLMASVTCGITCTVPPR